MRAGVASAARSEPSGSGLSRGVAGLRAEVCVRACDHNGARKNTGGDGFLASVHGPFPSTIPDAAGLALEPWCRFRLSDQRNGMHKGGYTATAAGTHVRRDRDLASRRRLSHHGGHLFAPGRAPRR